MILLRNDRNNGGRSPESCHGQSTQPNQGTVEAVEEP